VFGVVGPWLPGLFSRRGVIKVRVSRMALEKPGVAGDTPVDENMNFELDSSLLLSSGRHGEDSKRQYHTTLRHRYL
jgi:hypothetical protein